MPSSKQAKDPADILDQKLNEYQEASYLSDAATARHKTKDAVRAGDYDVAWRYSHEEKSNFLKEV